MFNLRFALLGLLALPLALSSPGYAQTLDTVRVASGLAKPLLATAPKGDARLFIGEQSTGKIKILKNGAVLPTAFLDLNTKIKTTGGEQGLLGLAFHPDYAANGLFFVNYSRKSDGATVVARYQVTANPDVADLLSEAILFTQSQPFTNHNGGSLAFSPIDGYLYVALGDGGSANDPGCRAQNLAELLGKILRLDVDSTQLGNYGIPSDNPFVSTPGARGEIFHYGVRNPFRLSFDRWTGDLYIGDVGQDAREEVSFAPAGASGRNFGWKVMEGFKCNSTSACPGTTAPCNDAAYTLPIHEYNNTGADNCMIGGYIYRGCESPSLNGTYFFADNGSDKLWSFDFDGVTKTNLTLRTAELAPGGGLTIQDVTSFGEDGFGEVYIVDGNSTNGEVYKIVVTGDTLSSDCDGNLKDDLCELTDNPSLDLDQNQTLDSCQALAGDLATIGLAAGGTQNLTLQAGVGQAGQLYFLLGSLSGTVPGLPVDSQLLPLNFDGYMLSTITAPNNPPLAGSLGFLSATGTAAASFSLPGGTGILGPLGVDHACVVINLISGSASFTSNPVHLTLQ